MMTPEEIDAERVGFEAWAKRQGYDLQKCKSGIYPTPTCYLWIAWRVRAELAKLDDEAREVGA